MSVKIGIGDGFGPTLAPPDYWTWIDFCEQGGIDSIWHSDQLLGPSVEPLTMLAAVAARTSRMRFGTNALVVPFRDPVVIAKEFATIDYLSGGRLLPVFGVGAATDAYWAATGARASERGQRANEAITLIRHLLEQEEVHFEGAHFRYSGPGVYPRPSKPLPLWIGGHSQAAIRRTAFLGDGWLGAFTAPEEAGKARLSIEAALKESGRTIDADHYGVTLPVRIGNGSDPAVAEARQRFSSTSGEGSPVSANWVVGSEAEVIKALRRYVDAGISKFVLLPIARNVSDLMDQTSRLAMQVLPGMESR